MSLHPNDSPCVFTLDERQNPMVKAIRKVNASDNPSDIINLVHDARRALAVMGAVFPIYDISTAPVSSRSISGKRRAPVSELSRGDVRDHRPNPRSPKRQKHAR
jgi:hypothetical protein